jgi:hypothetical protein
MRISDRPLAFVLTVMTGQKGARSALAVDELSGCFGGRALSNSRTSSMSGIGAKESADPTELSAEIGTQSNIHEGAEDRARPLGSRHSRSRLKAYMACSNEWPVSARRARCRAPRQRSPFQSHSGTGAAGTGLHGPNPPFVGDDIGRLIESGRSSHIPLAGAAWRYCRDNPLPKIGQPARYLRQMKRRTFVSLLGRV